VLEIIEGESEEEQKNGCLGWYKVEMGCKQTILVC